MIFRTATFSMQDARECLLVKWPDEHPFRSVANRAWIGFSVLTDGESPLLRVNDGPAIVVRMADKNREASEHEMANRGASTSDHLGALGMDHARRVVSFVRELQQRSEEFVLCVHCHAGVYRSGAVVEWLREDLGVVEDACSRRLVPLIGATSTREHPAFNETFLRLLRAAAAEERATSSR